MPENPRTWSTGRPRVTAAAVALALGTSWFTLRALSGATRRVAGGSMRPTLSDGDLVLTVPAWAREVRAGQVVIVRDPRDPRRRAVKRVAATAGAWTSLPDGPGRVPRGHVAVGGDDPTTSTDSRTYGAVPAELIERQVVGRLWPPRVLW